MPGTSTEQVVDKGIRQKSTKEWTHSLTAVPFVRGHRSMFPRTPRNTGVYTHHPTFVTATSGVLTRLPAKLSKNGMRVYTLSEVKGLRRRLWVRVTCGFIFCRRLKVLTIRCLAMLMKGSITSWWPNGCFTVSNFLFRPTRLLHSVLYLSLTVL